MSDWPISVVEPLVTINPWSLESIGAHLVSGCDFFATSWGINVVGSQAYPTANLALFIPFSVTKPIVAVKLFAYNGGTVSGNIDVGIYDANGVRLISSDSTAQAGTSATTALQSFDITDTQFGPGLFYLAVAMDNTTGCLCAVVPDISPAFTGMAQMATAFPLPAVATFASCATLYIPLIGLTTRTLV